MNTVVTSKEQILQTSRELIRQQGWSTVSIRSVAAACGVSVGSIYNYFDSKAELVGATVERDARVRPDAFTDQFTAEKFADVLFSLMLSALLRQDYDPTAVLEIVRRSLY